MSPMFQSSTRLNGLFIDTFYDLQSPKETGKFQEYTSNLWEFANTVEPFECKDIKTALTELMEANQNIDVLKDQLSEAKDKLELKAVEVCLIWTWCFNPPQFGGFGTIMMVLGLIVGIIIVCCCQKWCTGICSCCVPGNVIKSSQLQIITYIFCMFQNINLMFQNINIMFQNINLMFQNINLMFQNINLMF
jgi:hypothetical protein